MNNWLSNFYERKPEYRKLRVAKRTPDAIHFELERGRDYSTYEAHIFIDRRFERSRAGLWLPKSGLTDAVRLARKVIRNPRAALYFATALPFLTTLTVQPDATAGLDTGIRSGSLAARNFGISATIVVGVDASSRLARLLIQFSGVSAIPANANIGSGTITLFCSAADAGSSTVGVYRALTQWFEGSKNNANPDASQDGSTWNLRNANGTVAWGAAGGQSGTDYAASPTSSTVVTSAGVGVGVYNFDITADVAAWVSGAATNRGTWWISADEVTIRTKSFDTSDNVTAGNRPKLVIVYTVPSDNVFHPAFASAFRSGFN